MLHRKKFVILFFPLLLLGIGLAIYLPQQLKPLTLIVPLVFWMAYHAWVYAEKRQSGTRR